MAVRRDRRTKQNSPLPPTVKPADRDSARVTRLCLDPRMPAKARAAHRIACPSAPSEAIRPPASVNTASIIMENKDVHVVATVREINPSI